MNNYKEKTDIKELEKQAHITSKGARKTKKQKVHVPL